MLKRIEIEGFRSCKKLSLDNLGPFTVLVGRNAVGKSNILRAISWLATAATSSDASSLQMSSPGTRRVSVEIVLGQETYDYGLILTIERRTSRAGWSPDVSLVESLEHTNGDGVQTTVFRRQDKDVILAEEPRRISIGSPSASMPALLALLPAESRTVKLVRPVFRHLEAIRYYPLILDPDSLLRSFVPYPELTMWLAGHTHEGSLNRAVLMRIMDMKLNRHDQFLELQELLGPNGLAVIDEIRFTHLPPDHRQDEGEELYFLFFQPSGQRGSFGFDDLASGTQRLIAIITSLIYDRSAIMLLEHPEEGIHHALLRKLMGILQTHSDETQILMASHSAAVLDSLDPSAVRLVTMEEGDTKARALTDEELRFARQYLEEAGSLSDFLETVEED